MCCFSALQIGVFVLLLNVIPKFPQMCKQNRNADVAAIKF